MSDDSTREETCAVCGKSTDGNPGTAHLYHDGPRGNGNISFTVNVRP